MIAAGADKASVHPVGAHNFAVYYESAFAHLRNADIKLVEIGVGSAESMRGWLSYFPNAQVCGIDIVSQTNEWNDPKHKPHPRYTFVHGDQGSDGFWTEFVKAHGTGWDILCDDGSHANKDIITTFRMMWPHIRLGGYYAIEDLAAAYSNLEFFLKPGFPNHMDFIANMLHEINHGFNQIDEMRFSRELCILRKKL